MLFNLLSAASDAQANSRSNIGSLVLMGVLIVGMIAFYIYNGRAQKKKQEEVLQYKVN